MNETRSGGAPAGSRPQRIAVIAGDGAGRDVTAEAVKVMEALRSGWGVPIELESFPWSADHYLATGETLPEGALEWLARDYAAIFIGAFGDARVPDMKHAADILLGIRFGLDLYINLRPIKLYDQRLCPLKGKTEADVDFVVFRENTEGAYVGAGGQHRRGTPDEVAIQEMVYTRKGTERIIRAAFEYARATGRRKVCLTDKSNVLRFGHELWRRCFAEVATDFPEIETRAVFVDALAMFLIQSPEDFEVIVAPNMLGDILTDLGAALQGGLGLASSANLHPGRTSMFEPVHGSAPDLAGTGRANPLAALFTVVLMLQSLGHAEAAAAVEHACVASLKRGDTTPDLGGDLTTAAVGDAVAATVATGRLEAV